MYGADIVLFPEANLTGYDFSYVLTLKEDEINSALDIICKEGVEWGSGLEL
jgi:predicted amidohydrolase